jgi:hypothetical protein
LRRRTVKPSSRYSRWVFLRLISQPLAPQQNVQAAIAEPSALVRQIAQLLAERTIVIAARPVADDRPVRMR